MKQLFIKTMVFFMLASGAAISSAQDPNAYSETAQEVATDKETIRKFSSAYQSVISIQNDFTSKLQQVENNEEARELQEQAQAEMLKAVQDAGITVAQYNGIVSAMQNDEQLEERVMRQLN